MRPCACDDVGHARPRDSLRGCFTVSPLAMCILPLLAGCGGGPARVPVAAVDADGVAAALVARADADGDGGLSAAECGAVPGIARTIPQYDTDGDGRITPREIAERIRTWQATRVARVACSFPVTLDGRPLVDAAVRLEPEPEFAAHATPASGRTDATGRVAARAEGDLPGVPPGLYRVVVEHERLAKLPRYNSATILGIQVAPDDPGMMTLTIDLKSSPR
ncbi:MAG: hypothetical protein ACKOTB_02485 [Planctomycetia bacterium]